MNCTEQFSDVQRLHEPVIFVFQLVCFSSNWQNVLPPLEIVVQGFLVPGMLATRQPSGIGTSHWCDGSPFDIPKLQDCSVVAGKSGVAWAMASDGCIIVRPNRKNKEPTVEQINVRMQQMVA